MDSSFGVYIDRLQLMIFFSGYPLIYALVNAFAGGRSRINKSAHRIFTLLPLAYSLSGILFLGYLLDNIYPDFSWDNISKQFTFLKTWGLLSMIFFIKVFRKNPVISLLHSLVFFFFLIRDLFMHINSSIGIDMIKNDMSVYTNSLLLNTATLAVTILLYSIRKYGK